MPRELRFEVRERVTATGEVLVELEDDEIASVVEALKSSGVEACAVCFLFAFLNPDHERQLATALRAALPALELSLSSDVQPEFREYERFNTTVINAYLQPIMKRYMSDLESGLEDSIPAAAIGINQSSGGLMTPGRARDLPVRTALSGAGRRRHRRLGRGRLGGPPKHHHFGCRRHQCRCRPDPGAPRRNLL